jgi:hypothetical protein
VTSLSVNGGDATHCPPDNARAPDAAIRRLLAAREFDELWRITEVRFVR